MTMRRRLLELVGLATLLAITPGARAADSGAIPRTPDGRPDLSGTYDVATLTPSFLTSAVRRAGFDDAKLTPVVPGTTRLLTARR